MENVEKYVLACMVLHRYLRLIDNACYSPTESIDSEDKDGSIIPEEWRREREDIMLKCN